MSNENILEVKNLKKHFPIKAGVFQHVVGHVKSVDGVSFEIKRGQTFGLVGESGCGKTTTGRTILRLTEPTDGEAILNGKDIFKMSKKELQKIRPEVQIIFQDPYSSLDPRMPVGEIIGEAVRAHNIVPKEQYRDYILQIMKDCGLRPYHIDRYPHEFSGGQRQRLGVARAVASNPKLIIADEPISALDLSVQAQVLNFMKRIQKEYGLSYLFISHDLSVVKHMADDIAIMHRGRFVERGAKEKIFNNPQHIYTKRLLSAIPQIDPVNREAHMEERRAVEREYQEQEIHYYDENGRVYDLQKFEEDHWVALNPKDSSSKTLVTEQTEGGN